MHILCRWERNECGPVYIVIGDGGNREGLADTYNEPQPEWSAFRCERIPLPWQACRCSVQLHRLLQQNMEAADEALLTLCNWRGQSHDIDMRMLFQRSQEGKP